MSENPHSREHIKVIMLNASLYIAIQQISGSRRISQKAAILLTITEGAHSLGCLAEDDYKLLMERYTRELESIIAERQIKPESSHIPVVTIEKMKAAAKLKPHIDYSTLSYEQLQTKYDQAHRNNDPVEIQFIVFAARQRGFKLQRGAAI